MAKAMQLETFGQSDKEKLGQERDVIKYFFQVDKDILLIFIFESMGKDNKLKRQQRPPNSRQKSTQKSVCSSLPEFITDSTEGINLIFRI